MRRPHSPRCIYTGEPYNTQVDVYSFAITLLEIGCRDHRFVTKQFAAKGVGPLRLAAITATNQVGFRPIPKQALIDELPDLWALVSLLCAEAAPPLSREYGSLKSAEAGPRAN